MQQFMEGEHVTTSFVPYLVSFIRSHLNTMCKTYAPENEVLLDLKASTKLSVFECVARMRNIFEDRWGSGEPGSVYSEHLTRGYRQIRKGLPKITMLAAAIDPRTKKLKGIPPDDRKSVWDALHQYVVECTPAQDSNISQPGVDPTRLEFQDSLFGDLSDAEEDMFDVFESHDETLERELNAYRNQAHLSHSATCPGDPLLWWKQREGLYPNLAKAARKLLCIPATSAASERLFSKAGNIVTDLRCSLRPDHVEELLFLKSAWSKVEEYESQLSKKRKVG